MRVGVAFCSYGNIKLAKVHIRINGKEYMKVVEKELFGWADDELPGNWILCKIMVLTILLRWSEFGVKSKAFVS